MNQGRPFVYIYRGRFSNIKHRRVPVSISIDPDADFELRAIAFSCAYPCMVSVPGFQGELPSDLCSLRIPFPIAPAAFMRAGDKIAASVRLLDVVQIGRKRLAFKLAMIGVKRFRSR